MKIYKYQLETSDVQQIDIPIGARILSLQVQNGLPYIWALVSPNNVLEKRTFATFGTGHYVGSIKDSDFIGTYQLLGGSLVYHCFEIKNKQIHE